MVSLVSEGPVAGTVCQPGGVHLAEKVAGGRGTWWMGRYICQQTREGSDKKRKERGERREEIPFFFKMLFFKVRAAVG